MIVSNHYGGNIPSIRDNPRNISIVGYLKLLHDNNEIFANIKNLSQKGRSKDWNMSVTTVEAITSNCYLTKLLPKSKSNKMYTLNDFT